MMSETEKKCFNCKYAKFEMYGKNQCKHPNFVEIEYDGLVRKTYPACSSIYGENGECGYFQKSCFFKIKTFFGGLQLKYFKWKHPEWFI
jgi:hypothetical protein